MHTISKPGFWVAMAAIMTPAAIYQACHETDTVEIILSAVAALLGICLSLHYVVDKVFINMFGGGEDDV